METDKADMEMEADEDGVLAKILVSSNMQGSFFVIMKIMLSFRNEYFCF